MVGAGGSSGRIFGCTEHGARAHVFCLPQGEKVNVNWEGLLPIRDEIIVIEDDRTVRELIVEIIEDVNAKALAFETADEGLAYLLQSQGKCSLVIVDHGLPGEIQGIEFIELVRAKWPSISAILISGYPIDPESVPASSIYLHKPWPLDDLIIAIASLLQPDNPIHKS